MELIVQSQLGMTVAGFLLGSILGSFLNVCAHRIPIGLSIVSPPSFCPQCEARITWKNNLPILSWLIQKGQARCCGEPILSRYLFVEVVTALLFGYFFHRYFQNHNLAELCVGCFLGWVLLAVIVIDAETMMIPDRFSMGGALAGLVFSLIFPSLHGYGYFPLPGERILSVIDALIGLLVGSSVMYWIGAAAEKALGKEALGQGDVKLMGCIGAFCGWEAAVFMIFAGASIGTALVIPFIVFQNLKKKSSTQNPSGDQILWGKETPFGPYLAIATILYLGGLNLWVDQWIEAVLAIIGKSY